MKIRIEIHIRSHHFKEKKSFECDKCDKKFLLKISFIKHKTYVHLKDIKCLLEGCRKLFGSKSTMKRHYNRVHLNVKDKKYLQCDLCDFKAASKQHLTSHMSSQHLEIRPFKCNVCEYKACRKAHLKRHMRVHEPPMIKCPKCDKKLKEHFCVNCAQKSMILRCN